MKIGMITDSLPGSDFETLLETTKNLAALNLDVNKNGLGDVSCPTVRFCVAVGSTGPGVVSSAYIWNGTAWSATAPHLFAQDHLLP